MQPNSYFRDHIKGDTFQGMSIDYLDSNNNPIDLTSASVLIQFKYNRTDDEPVFEFSTSGSTVTIPDPTNGRLLMMPRILDVPEYNYIGDVQLTFPTSVVKTILTTYWRIIEDASR